MNISESASRIDLSVPQFAARLNEICATCLGLLRRARRGLNELDGLISTGEGNVHRKDSINIAQVAI